MWARALMPKALRDRDAENAIKFCNIWMTKKPPGDTYSIEFFVTILVVAQL